MGNKARYDSIENLPQGTMLICKDWNDFVQKYERLKKDGIKVERVLTGHDLVISFKG